MEWIASGGGPLLLLGKQLLGAWRGACGRGELVGGPHVDAGTHAATDYDRACQIAGYVNVLTVGQGQGLVLSGDVLDTAWYPLPEAEGGLLVRWIYAENDEDVQEALRSLPPDIAYEGGPDFDVSDATLVLFDSVMEGTDILTPSMEINLKAGPYRVLTAQYDPVPETSLLLHRLVPR